MGARPRAAGHLESIGGLAYLASLSDHAARGVGVETYAGLVLEASVRRSLEREAQAAAASAVDDGADAAATLATTRARLARLQAKLAGGDSALIDADEAMIALCGRVNALLAGKSLAGLPTGFARLDAVAGGLCPGQLVTVAARTGIGKTSFALQVAFSAAQTVPVAIFSLEMSQEEVLLRAIAQHADIDSSAFFRGYLGRHRHADVAAAVTDLSERQWAICDEGTLTVADVRRHGEAMKVRRGLGLVVVDYLQLLSPSPGTAGENRTQQVGAMSRGLKNLARDLEVPILMLSQLSRATDGRVGKRPQLSDLRESGSIEHDSDKVLFIHRDDDHTDQNTEAVILVAKNRTGPTGAVPVTFIKHATRFEEAP